MHKKLERRRLLGFALGMAAAFGINESPALAVPVVSVVAETKANINFVWHSHGCEKMTTSPGGTLHIFGNGIKNTNTTSALQLACALVAPGDGFDAANDYVGLDVVDQNKKSSGGSVSVKVCYTARGVLGAGCTASANTPSAMDGLYAVQIPFPSAIATLGGSSVFLDVTLPIQDGNLASVVRSFGYYDASFVAGGGGGGDGEVQGQISSLQSAIASLTTAVNNHSNQLSGVAESGLNTAINAIDGTVSQHTSQLSGSASSGLKMSINTLDGTVSAHTAMLEMQGTTLSTQSGLISTNTSKVASLEQAVFKRVFASSTVHAGNIGNLATIDGICQARATEASLGGTWKAWISNDSGTPANRFTKHSGVYRLVTGTLVAYDFQDLLDGQLQTAINRDELARSVGGLAWTATTSNGMLQSGHCGNWSDGTVGLTGLAGDTSSTSAAWTNLMNLSCNSQLRLYCVEQ